MSVQPKFPKPDSRILPAQIELVDPPSIQNDPKRDRVLGSFLGLSMGDALGASTEFRPRSFLQQNPVSDIRGGGTWGLKPGQWTDDTSMALCSAVSLILNGDFNPYDQMVHFKWWRVKGYLSSTGECFDIGNATASAIETFLRRQNQLKQTLRNNDDSFIDYLPGEEIKKNGFNPYCGKTDHAGNGPLMRLAPIPLFFYREPSIAIEIAGASAALTHGDQRAIDSCRYYAALIVAAILGEDRKSLLDDRFYENHFDWFNSKPLHDEVLVVARGSYKRERGYDDGIRGKNFIVNTLEAALWAFYKDEQSFKKGACNAVNLGDDTDTTAAVYGQLAGAHYGLSNLPRDWLEKIYAKEFLVRVAGWLFFQGQQKKNYRNDRMSTGQSNPLVTVQNWTSQKPVDSSLASQKPSSNQQMQHKNPTDRVGYGASANQVFHHSTASSSANSAPRFKPDGRLDPSSLPPAGVGCRPNTKSHI